MICAQAPQIQNGQVHSNFIKLLFNSLYETKEFAAFFRTTCVASVETLSMSYELLVCRLNVEAVGEMQGGESTPRQTEVRRTSSWYFGELENVGDDCVGSDSVKFGFGAQRQAMT